VAATHKCPHCYWRVKRAPFISLTDRGTRREARYHGGSCSPAGLARAEDLGPDRVILRFAHPRAQLAATRRARWIVEVVFCGQRCAARGGEKCRERAQSVATRAGMR
jgi:hypothetical protein